MFKLKPFKIYKKTTESLKMVSLSRMSAKVEEWVFDEQAFRMQCNLYKDTLLYTTFYLILLVSLDIEVNILKSLFIVKS